MIFFFFQAEDGIRDLVRSRGLGDVYKRQYQRRVRGCFGSNMTTPSENVQSTAGAQKRKREAETSTQGVARAAPHARNKGKVYVASMKMRGPRAVKPEGARSVNVTSAQALNSVHRRDLAR
eukprot:TRINITY_DN16276_c0_g1_i1.p2 TRINITY_DN16276_c0_g1~~TRINITY_DN16276_c0_g1_i1.p2  ORF type:complete len:121 (+),score=21.22 TRINITY_DN16276_c0_g1_i1:65-427(+)